MGEKDKPIPLLLIVPQDVRLAGETEEEALEAAAPLDEALQMSIDWVVRQVQESDDDGGGAAGEAAQEVARTVEGHVGDPRAGGLPLRTDEGEGEDRHSPPPNPARRRSTAPERGQEEVEARPAPNVQEVVEAGGDGLAPLEQMAMDQLHPDEEDPAPSGGVLARAGGESGGGGGAGGAGGEGAGAGAPDHVVHDLRRAVGLRNVVLHFRVPRNRVSRARCRAAVPHATETRMRREETKRRWAREKLATVGHAAFFSDYERVGAQEYLLDAGLYGSYFKTGVKKTVVDSKGDARRAATDRRGFPHRRRIRPKSWPQNGFNLGRDATYETLGEGRNFFVLAADSPKVDGERYVFTIFPASGSVVATGLRAFPSGLPARTADEMDTLPDVLKTFNELTGIPATEIREIKVTNSTWSGSLRPKDVTPEELGSVMRVISDYSQLTSGKDGSEMFSVDFRSQFFPGVRMQHTGMAGTINLFNNGSFVIVGVRKASEAVMHLRWLAAIMNKFWKRPGAGTSCAWVVG